MTKGESGMASSCKLSLENARSAAKKISSLEGFSLTFPNSAFFNEFVISTDVSFAEISKSASSKNIHIGVEVSDRFNSGKTLIKISFSDLQTEDDVNTLVSVFEEFSDGKNNEVEIPEIDSQYLRSGTLNLPEYTREKVHNYYMSLGEQNISPDTTCYPLGSCMQ